MNLISQIIFAILITMMTGVLAYIIWRLTMPLCMKWHPRLPYVLLCIVCILFMVPINYLGMQIGSRDGYLQTDGVWQLHFAPVGELWCVVAILATGWILLAGRQIRVCLFHWAKKWKIDRYNEPEEDETVRKEFAKVKEKLHIRKNIRLYRNGYVPAPEIEGICRVKVILPKCDYDSEQLAVIFYHELMHYKKRHLLFKFFGRMIGIIYPIGFINEKLKESLNEWVEHDCDVCAIAAMSDRVSTSDYFEMIIDSMAVPSIAPSVYQDENHIFLGLYENQSGLGRRIDYMKNYENKKKVTGVVTAVLAMTFAVMSVTTVYASGSVLEEVHNDWYTEADSNTMESETVDNTVLEEFYLTAEEDNSYEKVEFGTTSAKTADGMVEYYVPAEESTLTEDSTEVIMPLLDEEELADIDWTVSPATRKLTKTFHVEAGQAISVSTTATPLSSVYWIGIMDEANALRYVQGSGSIAHEFAIDEAGSYRVIVQNRSRVTLNVNGTYAFYTPTEEDTEE